jgi:GNAT superfamily N-acetyltransferase
MYKIFTANKEQHIPQIRDLFLEYLHWININLVEYYGFGIDDVQKYVEEDIQHIEKFFPPTGRFLLCYVEDLPVGMAALKQLEPGIGEVKRMYVRPEYRRRGLGRALLSRLLEEADQINFQCLRLDSAPFLIESHQLYRTFGFKDIQPYKGTEVPEEFQMNWIFMERQLLKNRKYDF